MTEYIITLFLHKTKVEIIYLRLIYSFDYEYLLMS